MAKIESIVTSGLQKMDHKTDPKSDICANLSEVLAGDFLVYGPQVLVATYVRPAKTAGGIWVTERSRAEDEYQGKTGLVIALGPTAFKETKDVDFGGLIVKVGDWVVISPHDGLAMSINKQHCRLVDDVQIRAVVKRPDMLL